MEGFRTFLIAAVSALLGGILGAAIHAAGSHAMPDVQIDWGSNTAAAWVQAAGAVLTIIVTGGFAIFELTARSRIKADEKRINYSIARDIYADSVSQLKGFYGYDGVLRHVARTIVKSNVELIQQIAFKDLPSNDAANDMFAMRTYIISIHAIMERWANSPEVPATADELLEVVTRYRDQPRNASGPLFDV